MEKKPLIIRIQEALNLPKHWRSVSPEPGKTPPATWQEAVAKAVKAYQKNWNEDQGYTGPFRAHDRLEEDQDSDIILDKDLPPLPAEDTDPGEWLRSLNEIGGKGDLDERNIYGPDTWEFAALLAEQAGLDPKDGESNYDELCAEFDKLWPLKDKSWSEVIRGNLDT